LNVLDRCAHPRAVLTQLKRALAPNGRLAIALVLPYVPFYYAGASTPEPLEPLNCRSPVWEAAAGEFVNQELATHGLEVLALSRVPYLSSGDTGRSHYALDALVTICRAHVT
jgi:hypothetical protein